MEVEYLKQFSPVKEENEIDSPQKPSCGSNNGNFDNKGR